MGFAHRDIKTDNILLTKEHTVKIIDFGLGNYFRKESSVKTTCGSPEFAAPEIVRGDLYDPIKSDIWACGVTLYRMVNVSSPFISPNLQGLYQKIKTGDISPLRNGISEACNKIINKILVTDPNSRPSIKEILLDSWIRMKGARSICYQQLSEAQDKIYGHLINQTAKMLKLTPTEVLLIIKKRFHSEAYLT